MVDAARRQRTELNTTNMDVPAADIEVHDQCHVMFTRESKPEGEEYARLFEEIITAADSEFQDLLQYNIIILKKHFLHVRFT